MQQAICHLVKVACYLKSAGWASLEASVDGLLLLKHWRMPKAGSSKNPAQSFKEIAIIRTSRGFYFIFREFVLFPWLWWDTMTTVTYRRKVRMGFSPRNQSVAITVEMRSSWPAEQWQQHLGAGIKSPTGSSEWMAWCFKISALAPRTYFPQQSQMSSAYSDSLTDWGLRIRASESIRDIFTQANTESLANVGWNLLASYQIRMQSVSK